LWHALRNVALLLWAVFTQTGESVSQTELIPPSSGRRGGQVRNHHCDIQKLSPVEPERKDRDTEEKQENYSNECVVS